MIEIKFKTPTKEISIQTNASNLMEAALENGIEGIHGDCSGVGSCGTCHVHIDPEWIHQTGSAQPSEMEVLELQENVCPRSRLACQINLESKLHQLIVHLPNLSH